MRRLIRGEERFILSRGWGHLCLFLGCALVAVPAMLAKGPSGALVASRAHRAGQRGKSMRVSVASARSGAVLGRPLRTADKKYDDHESSPRNPKEQRKLERLHSVSHNTSRHRELQNPGTPSPTEIAAARKLCLRTSVGPFCGSTAWGISEPWPLLPSQFVAHRVSPPAHPETMPSRVVLTRDP